MLKELQDIVDNPPPPTLWIDEIAGALRREASFGHTTFTLLLFKGEGNHKLDKIVQKLAVDDQNAGKGRNDTFRKHIVNLTDKWRQYSDVPVKIVEDADSMSLTFDWTLKNAKLNSTDN